MEIATSLSIRKTPGSVRSSLVALLAVLVLCPFDIFSQTPRKPVKPQRNPSRAITVSDLPDSIPLGQTSPEAPVVVVDEFSALPDTVLFLTSDTLAVRSGVNPQTRVFNPDPTRAVWLAALCPGLGQIYNHSYWKLPIVIGAYVGLGYATSWNNSMLRDYTRAYADLMDNDPNTKSYMDFFPSTTQESDLNRTWLTNTFKSRKDYFRRNRDLCIICMVGVYLIAIVDAYVDATLMHFDISPDLSLEWTPTMIPDTRSRWPGMGLQWALNF